MAAPLSNNVWLAIIAAVNTVLVALVGLVGIVLSRKQTAIHKLVNSKSDDQLADIRRLNGELATLRSEPSVAMNVADIHAWIRGPERVHDIAAVVEAVLDRREKRT